VPFAFALSKATYDAAPELLAAAGGGGAVVEFTPDSGTVPARGKVAVFAVFCEAEIGCLAVVPMAPKPIKPHGLPYDWPRRRHTNMSMRCTVMIARHLIYERMLASQSMHLIPPDSMFDTPTQTYMHAHAHSTRTHGRTHAHARTHADARTHIQTRTHTHILTYTRIHTHAHRLKLTSLPLHTNTNTQHIHTQNHTHTHTRTHTAGHHGDLRPAGREGPQLQRHLPRSQQADAPVPERQGRGLRAEGGAAPGGGGRRAGGAGAAGGQRARLWPGGRRCGRWQVI
jgi:hypothetical protein